MAKSMEFAIKTGEQGFYNITRQITEAIEASGVEDGMALIYCPHTTAGITITENTDKNVGLDMLLGIDRAFPDLKEFLHREGNSFAHIRSSMLGCEAAVIVESGWPLLGPFQAVFFVEFDGPRDRRFLVKVLEG